MNKLVYLKLNERVYLESLKLNERVYLESLKLNQRVYLEVNERVYFKLTRLLRSC